MGLLLLVLFVLAALWLVSTLVRGAAAIAPGGLLGLIVIVLVLWLIFRA